MPSLEFFTLLSASVFLGAFVAGLVGFAFSAVCGAILLHSLEPREAVPLMMACSVGVQGANLWALRKSIRWKESATLSMGGLLGLPIALWLLQNTNPRTFQQLFGLVLAAYSAYMFFKPAGRLKDMSDGQTALVGFGSGVLGGLTAMPGALPTIWCDMHGLPKSDQRGVVQPFIAAMQVTALLMLFAHHDLPMRVAWEVALSAPALFAGSAIGVTAFRKVNDASFRRLMVSLLFVSGLILLI